MHKVCHGPTNKVLWFSFFLLGSGLMAPWGAVLQCMDLLNALYADFNPSRILTVCYVAVDLVALFSLFFFGHKIWPNKKTRMLAGYCIYATTLVVLPVADVLMAQYMPHSLDTGRGHVGGYIVWAVCSAAAGGADALISTVAYGESAAIGPRYTHAFVGGKATAGLLLSALRCISKGAMGKDLHGLRTSTVIFLSFAAAIVLGCVLVVAYVLPKQRQQIDRLKARPGLSVQQTLQLMRMATLSRRFGSRHIPAYSPPDTGTPDALSPPSPGSSPGKMLSKLPSLKRALSSSAEHSLTHLLQPRLSLFDVIEQALLQQQQQAAAGVRVHANSASGGGLGSGDVESGTPLKSIKEDEGSEEGSSSSTAAALQMHRDLHDMLQQHGNKPSAAAAAWHKVTALVVKQQGAGQQVLASRVLDTGGASSEEGTGSSNDEVQRRAAAVADCQEVDARPAATSHAGEKRTPASTVQLQQQTACTLLQQQEQQPPEQPCEGLSPFQLAAARPSAGSAKRQAVPTSSSESPTSAAKTVKFVAQKGSGKDKDIKASEVGPPAQLRVKLPRSQYSLARFAAGGLVREGLSTASSSWLAVRLMYPYMTAVALVFFVANFVFPMCLSPQVGKWKEVGTWYTLILVVSYELGTLVGSITPIWKPKHPRAVVLSMALGMFAFVPAYLLALVLKAGPGAFVTLTFIMMTYGSYIAAMVFVLAPHGLLAADCELVEVLMVLVLTLGYICGLFLSWLWKLVAFH